MSEERRAPFAGKKPKKPEYEETPIVSVHQPEPESPPQRRIIPEPTVGGLARDDRELPVTHLEQEHPDYLHYLLTRFPPKPETPVIHGRTPPPVEPKPRQVTPEPTKTEVTGETKLNPTPLLHPKTGEVVGWQTQADRWEMAATRNIHDNAVEPSTRATGHKVIPKDKEDAEHKEA